MCDAFCVLCSFIKIDFESLPNRFWLISKIDPGAISKNIFGEFYKRIFSKKFMMIESDIINIW
jgi:hypothetical protein